MGIFGRKSQGVPSYSCPDIDLQYIGKQLELSVNELFMLFESASKESDSELESNVDSKKVAEEAERSLHTLCIFLSEIVGTDQSGLDMNPDSHVSIDWAKLGFFANRESDYQREIGNPNDRVVKLTGVLLQSCSRLNLNTKSGFLLTMPNATIENSQAYRTYLTANSVSSELGWDWENFADSPRKRSDNNVALAVSAMATRIFDRCGESQLSNKGCLIGVLIILNWEKSMIRRNLG